MFWKDAIAEWWLEMQCYIDKRKINKCSCIKFFAYRWKTCCSKLVKKTSDTMGAIFCEPNILYG